MKKLYFVLKDGTAGYIDYLCDCKECKKRGKYEYYIRELDGSYLDSVTYDSLLESVFMFTFEEKLARNIATFGSDIVKKGMLKDWNDKL